MRLVDSKSLIVEARREGIQEGGAGNIVVSLRIEFKSQHPQDGLRLSITPVPGVSNVLF